MTRRGGAVLLWLLPTGAGWVVTGAGAPDPARAEEEAPTGVAAEGTETWLVPRLDDDAPGTVAQLARALAASGTACGALRLVAGGEAEASLAQAMVDALTGSGDVEAEGIDGRSPRGGAARETTREDTGTSGQRPNGCEPAGGPRVGVVVDAGPDAVEGDASKAGGGSVSASSSLDPGPRARARQLAEATALLGRPDAVVASVTRNGARLELEVIRLLVPFPGPARLALPVGFGPRLGLPAIILSETTWLVPLDAELRMALGERPRARNADTVVARASRTFDLDAPPAGALGGLRGRLLVVAGDVLVDLAVERDLRGRPVPRTLRRARLPERRGAGSPRPRAFLALEGTSGEAPGEPTPTARVQVAGRAPGRLRPSGWTRALEPARLPEGEDVCQGVGPRDANRGPVLDRVRLAGGRCAARIPPGDRLAASPWPGVLFAHAARRLRQGDGSVVSYEAATTEGGAVAARVDGREVAVRGYGAPLGLADVDGDGSAELLVTSAVDGDGDGDGDPGRPRRDRLHLLRLEPDGRLIDVWRSSPLNGTVRVATGGDVDGDGSEELVAFEESAGDHPGDATLRMWVIR